MALDQLKRNERKKTSKVKKQPGYIKINGSTSTKKRKVEKIDKKRLKAIVKKLESSYVTAQKSVEKFFKFIPPGVLSTGESNKGQSIEKTKSKAKSNITFCGEEMSRPEAIKRLEEQLSNFKGRKLSLREKLVKKGLLVRIKKKKKLELRKELKEQSTGKPCQKIQENSIVETNIVPEHPSKFNKKNNKNINKKGGNDAKYAAQALSDSDNCTEESTEGTLNKDKKEEEIRMFDKLVNIGRKTDSKSENFSSKKGEVKKTKFQKKLLITSNIDSLQNAPDNLSGILRKLKESNSKFEKEDDIIPGSITKMKNINVEGKRKNEKNNTEYIPKIEEENLKNVDKFVETKPITDSEGKVYSSKKEMKRAMKEMKRREKKRTKRKAIKIKKKGKINGVGDEESSDNENTDSDGNRENGTDVELKPQKMELENLKLKRNTGVSDIMFNKLDFHESEGTGKKRAIKDPKRALQMLEKTNTKIKHLQTTGREEKAERIKKRVSWSRVMDKAEGVKVKDDLELIKKSIRKKEGIKNRSKKKWDERNQQLKQKMQDAQTKRRENIMAKKKEKKAKKLKRAIKKGRFVV